MQGIGESMGGPDKNENDKTDFDATFDSDIGSQIAEVLLRSKADGPPPLSSDGQVVLKITRFTHAHQTNDAIMLSDSLAYCRARVSEAGCEIMPSWAGGARLLVPFTEAQLQELNEAGKELQPWHLVALRSDIDAIIAAFADVKSKARARVQHDESFLRIITKSSCKP